jgi:hypothetical protein
MLELILIKISLDLLDIDIFERSSPTIISYLCVFEISSWICFSLEGKFLYKYVLDWLIKDTDNIPFVCIMATLTITKFVSIGSGLIPSQEGQGDVRVVIDDSL